MFWLTTQLLAGYAILIPMRILFQQLGFAALIFIPILVHGLGDGLAEPVGVRFGKHKYFCRAFLSKRRYTRSLEGSSCVFLAGLAAVLTFHASFTPPQFIAALLIVPIGMTLAEAFSPHTWDTPYMFLIGTVQLYVIPGDAVEHASANHADCQRRPETQQLRHSSAGTGEQAEDNEDAQLPLPRAPTHGQIHQKMGNPHALAHHLPVLSGPSSSSAAKALKGLSLAREYMNYGFTTLRDLRSVDPDWPTVDLRNALNSGLVEGPRLFVAAHIISASAGHGDLRSFYGSRWTLPVSAIADDRGDIRALVRRECLFTAVFKEQRP